MEWQWPGHDTVPVVLNAGRPGRHRGRQNSEHPNRQPVYFQDSNGLLTPAGEPVHHRAASTGTHRHSPAQIVINNSQRDEHSPPMDGPHHRHHRHSSHDHGIQFVDDDQEWVNEHAMIHHSPPRRRRGHSRSHSSRSPSPIYDPELEKRLRKLEDLEKKEEEEAARERFEEERMLEEVRKAKKKKEEEELKKKAVEEYHIKQLEEKEEEKKKKEKEDKEFKERAMKTFAAAGYSEGSIERILKRGEKGEKNNHGHTEGKRIVDLTRPTYIKVHRKHLSPDTLDAYDLPWDWDTKDHNFIVIKKWIPEYEQDILFEHTKRLREKKMLTDTTIELRKEKDNLMLVRKKSNGRSRSRARSHPRSYIFT